MGRGGEIAIMMALTLRDGSLTVRQRINGTDTTGTGVKGIVMNPTGANARGARGGPRSALAEGGTVGTIDSVSPSGFAISTQAGVTVTVEIASHTTYQERTSSTSASALTKGESVLVLGTVNLGAANLTTITASQVIVQPAGGGGSGTVSAAGVVLFQRGAPSAAKQVGQIPANYTQGSGTIVGETEANKATGPALAACAGGIVDRVVRLSTGEYEVHNIGVNWPHHIFVNQDFKVIGAE
jgi:microcompartment protein CcmK/EutM